MRFRKKPVVVEAIQWDGDLSTVEKLMEGSTCESVEQDLCDPALVIVTLEGKMRAEVGDWIITSAGSQRSCSTLSQVEPSINFSTVERLPSH